jgi:hypothetical protein
LTISVSTKKGSIEEDFMRQTAVLKVLAALVIFGPAAFAADPELLSMVMPDAKLLAGMNVGSTFASPFGQFLIAKIPTLGEQALTFAAATGFNPLQDMSEVLAATTGDVSRPGGLLLVRGKFNPEKIRAAVAATLSNTQVQSYAGTTLLSGTNPKTNTKQTLAFIGNSIAVSGDLADVEAALDRNSAAHGAAHAASIAIDPALLAQVNQLSSAEDEWLVSSGSVASQLSGNTVAPGGPAAQVLPLMKNIQSFAGGLKFGTNVQLTGQALTTDTQNATALAAVLKLGVTFASTLAGNNAQLKDLAELLQSLQVTLSDSTVSVSLAIPETEVEDLLDKALNARTPGLKAQLLPRQLLNGN